MDGAGVVWLLQLDRHGRLDLLRLGRSRGHCRNREDARTGLWLEGRRDGSRGWMWCSRGCGASCGLGRVFLVSSLFASSVIIIAFRLCRCLSQIIADYRRISLQNTVVDAPTWSVTGCKKQRCRMFPPRASSIVVAVPAAPLLIFLSVSLSESLLRVLRALRSPHTRCSFPQTASVGRRVFKVGVTKRKKTESPLARWKSSWPRDQHKRSVA